MALYRFAEIAPERNERRWYVIHCGRTLFGTWAVLRAWGRIGTNWSQRRVEEYEGEDEAWAEVEAQVERRGRREYVAGERGPGQVTEPED